MSQQNVVAYVVQNNSYVNKQTYLIKQGDVS